MANSVTEKTHQKVLSTCYDKCITTQIYCSWHLKGVRGFVTEAVAPESYACPSLKQELIYIFVTGSRHKERKLCEGKNKNQIEPAGTKMATNLTSNRHCVSLNANFTLVALNNTPAFSPGRKFQTKKYRKEVRETPLPPRKLMLRAPLHYQPSSYRPHLLEPHLGFRFWLCEPEWKKNLSPPRQEASGQ